MADPIWVKKEADEDETKCGSGLDFQQQVWSLAHDAVFTDTKLEEGMEDNADDPETEVYTVDVSSVKLEPLDEEDQLTPNNRDVVQADNVDASRMKSEPLGEEELFIAHQKDVTEGKKGSKERSKLKNDWVRSMDGLWSIQPKQFINEQVHNFMMADQKPGCCVCKLFYNEKVMFSQPYRSYTNRPMADQKPGCRVCILFYKEKGDTAVWGNDEAAFSSSNSQVAGTSRDQRSRVLCPEMCFACCSENPTPLIENPAVDAQGMSPIIHCVSCKIAVHAACYGEDPPTITDKWKCDRCKEEDWQFISCCLCNLRGGALKPTTTGRWAHIVCAMAITEVSFQNVKQRSPIDVTKISPRRLKLKCYFCRSFIKYSPKYASCIQCSVGKCAVPFHVTCAEAAGVMMEPSNWPYPVYATCSKHPFANKDIIRRAGLSEISTREKVIAKHKNSRYYKAEVIGERKQMFCHVNFCDNSFSKNLSPEDIESHNIQRDGPPAAGTRVMVRWTDGLLYDGYYVKDSLVKIDFDVKFQDGSVVTVKREDIYSKGEGIPKRVRMKLSIASKMRHWDFHRSRVIVQKHRKTRARTDQRLSFLTQLDNDLDS